MNETREPSLRAAKQAPCTTARLSVFRERRQIEVPVVLGEQPAERQALGPGPEPGGARALEGFSVTNLTPRLREQLGLPPAVSGVLVTGVDPGSPAFEAGLRRGDVIQEVNGRRVASVAERVKNRVPAARLADVRRCGSCKAALGPVSELLEVDEAAFEEIVGGAPVPVLVDFRAAWCGPCRVAAPEVAAPAREMAGRALVLKVDTKARPELAARHRVQAIPNFVVLRRGRRCGAGWKRPRLPEDGYELAVEFKDYWPAGRQALNLRRRRAPMPSILASSWAAASANSSMCCSAAGSGAARGPGLRPAARTWSPRSCRRSRKRIAATAAG